MSAYHLGMAILGTCVILGLICLVILAANWALQGLDGWLDRHSRRIPHNRFDGARRACYRDASGVTKR